MISLVRLFSDVYKIINMSFIIIIIIIVIMNHVDWIYLSDLKMTECNL